MYRLRPLYVVLALIAVILAARTLVVPEDFGIHETGYMYGWYRKSNEQEWKTVRVKYQGQVLCRDCHPEPHRHLRSSSHSAIQCENCHGPATEHPSDPPKLSIDRSRQLCLRCHAFLFYPTSQRSEIRGIDPAAHNPDGQCADCHDPHAASKPQ